MKLEITYDCGCQETKVFDMRFAESSYKAIAWLLAKCMKYKHVREQEIDAAFTKLTGCGIHDNHKREAMRQLQPA